MWNSMYICVQFMPENYCIFMKNITTFLFMYCASLLMEGRCTYAYEFTKPKIRLILFVHLFDFPIARGKCLVKGL